MSVNYNKWNKRQKHKLVTAEIAKKLPPLYANEEKDAKDVPVVFKLFNPSGSGTWYITEGDLETGIMFGYCVIHEGELGYVSLEELVEFKGRFGLGIERDEWFGPATLADVMEGRKS